MWQAADELMVSRKEIALCLVVFNVYLSNDRDVKRNCITNMNTSSTQLEQIIKFSGILVVLLILGLGKTPDAVAQSNAASKRAQPPANRICA